MKTSTEKPGRTGESADLPESSKLLCAVWDTMPDAMALSDPKGIILQANKAYRALYGITEGGLSGQKLPLSETEPSDGASLSYRQLFNAQDAPTRRKLTIPGKNGSKRVVEARFEFVVEEKQRIALLTILHDVSDTLPADATSRDNGELYRTVLENIPGSAVLLFDRDFTVLYAGGVDFAKGNIDPGRLTGAKVYDHLPPGTWEQQAQPIYMKTLKGLTTTEEISRNDHTFEVTFAPIKNNDGSIIGGMVVTRDITERKEAEKQMAQWAAIVQSAEDAIISMDLDGTILTWNKGAEKLYGYTAEEAMGQSISLILPPEKISEVHTIVERFMTTNDSATYETIRSKKDGTRLNVSVTSSPIRDAAGNIIAGTAIVRDITERKEIEAQIQYQANLIQNVSDAIVSTSPDLTIESWNAAAEKMYGWKAEEVIGKPSAQILQTEYAVGGRAEIVRTLKEVGLWQGEVTQVRRDGTLMHAHASTSYLKDDTGKIVGIVSVNRDITERKEIEAQIRYQANLIENVSDAILSTNAGFVIESWNAAAEKMYGWKAEEVIGKVAMDVLRTSYNSIDRRSMLEKLGESGSWHGEVGHQHKDGTSIQVQASIARLIDVDGKEAGIVSVNRNVTEQKLAEERQLFLAKASEVLASSLDYETTLPAIAQLVVRHLADWCTINLVAEDGTLRQIAAEHVDPSKAKWVEELRKLFAAHPHANRGPAQVIATGFPEYRSHITDETLANYAESPGLLKALHKLELSSSMVVPLKVHGRTFGAISLATTPARRRFAPEDLALAEELARRAALAVDNAQLYRTAQGLNEKLEQRVAERTVELEATNKELEAFSYSVSHDLRAPVSHILGFAQLLRARLNATLDDKEKRYMNNIAESATWMGTLIDDLLSFSRVSRTDLRKAQFEMVSLVREVIDDMQHELQDRDVQWRIDPLASVWVDRSMMRLVWTNLISNALKYSQPRPQAHIEIGQYQDEHENVFFIRDNGVGFDMKYVDKLFGVFQRLHSKSEFDGTGIGLANVRRIVSRHGGRTWAEGAVDAGATIYFSLPVSETEPFKET